jgi:protein gp37
MNRTKIEWCDFVFNPVVGCTGSCPYCYARNMMHRFGVTLYGTDDFDTPRWVEWNFQRKFPRKPSRIFVNSMSDLADWKNAWRARVFSRIDNYPQHLFLFLSKRPWNCEWIALPNAMLGYSVTRQKDWNDLLLRGPGHVTFLSIEPILEPIILNSRWLPRWIICGAETGNRKGRVVPKTEWLREIFGFCQANNIPLFFKDSLRNFWPRDMHFPREFPKEMP